MKNSTGSIAKSVAVGLAVGGAAAAISGAVMNNGSTMKKAKKNAAKAMKTVSGMMDNVSAMKNFKF
ncbi:MAG: hypothetical protein PUB85_04275 [Clostridia bacterium]|nr:hypothetical protein [Oscillospiraceae bacterium]MDD6220189.1 hypothetical protein [Clostridia bacterium]